MANLEKFKFLTVFGFEHHHFTTFMKYFFPKIFEIILCIQFSLPELGQFTWFLKKVENIQNCQKSANFHLPWAAPFCNFSKNFFDKNTSFVLYFWNFTTRGLNNSINFYLETVYYTVYIIIKILYLQKCFWIKILYLHYIFIFSLPEVWTIQWISTWNQSNVYWRL